jgi:hypothetical protein
MVRVERMVLVEEDVLIFSRGISDMHAPRPAATRKAHFAVGSRGYGSGAVEKCFTLHGYKRLRNSNFLSIGGRKEHRRKSDDSATQRVIGCTKNTRTLRLEGLKPAYEWFQISNSVAFSRARKWFIISNFHKMLSVAK